MERAPRARSRWLTVGPVFIPCRWKSTRRPGGELASEERPVFGSSSSTAPTALPDRPGRPCQLRQPRRAPSRLRSPRADRPPLPRLPAPRRPRPRRLVLRRRPEQAGRGAARPLPLPAPGRRVPPPRGRRRQRLADAEVAAVVVNFRDVTERRAEQALVESEIASAPCSIGAGRHRPARSGRAHRRHQPRHRRDVRLSAHELRGRIITDFIHEDERDQAQRDWRELADGGVEHNRAERRIVRATAIRSGSRSPPRWSAISRATRASPSRCSRTSPSASRPRRRSETNRRLAGWVPSSRSGGARSRCSARWATCWRRRSVEETTASSSRWRQLFPEESGSISVIGAGSGLVETVAAWGPVHSTSIFSTDDCWRCAGPAAHRRSRRARPGLQARRRARGVGQHLRAAAGAGRAARRAAPQGRRARAIVRYAVPLRDDRRRLASHKSQELAYRLPGNRIHHVWRNLCQRLQNEPPGPEARVRHDEARLVQNLISTT